MLTFCCVFNFVKSNGRLKQLIFRFMAVPCKWIKSSRHHVLKMGTKKKMPLASWLIALCYC